MSHAAVAHHTSTGLDSRKIAFWTFIGSECLLFGSLIATYLVYEGKSVSGPTTHEILNIPLTSFSTFDLLMSSLAMVLALAAVQRGDRVWARVWLAATALLGSIFLGLQAYEFTHFVREGLGFTTNLFGSTFFTLTGCHGTHVFVGVIWLTTLLVRSFQGKLGPEKALNVEIAGLYWHFVDVVWIVIFTVVYLIQTTPLPGERAHAAHASTMTYLVVAAILTLITVVEVGVFYMPAMHPVLAPTLLVLSAAKFTLVVGFYMHLRYDHNLFRAVFALPLLIAAAVIIGLLFLFRVL
jgi:heme/copper-type cytochrome/quinol oxidase subunit 3